MEDLIIGGLAYVICTIAVFVRSYVRELAKKAKSKYANILSVFVTVLIVFHAGMIAIVYFREESSWKEFVFWDCIVLVGSFVVVCLVFSLEYVFVIFLPNYSRIKKYAFSEFVEIELKEVILSSVFDFKQNGVYMFYRKENKQLCFRIFYRICKFSELQAIEDYLKSAFNEKPVDVYIETESDSDGNKFGVYAERSFPLPEEILDHRLFLCFSKRMQAAINEMC